MNFRSLKYHCAFQNMNNNNDIADLLPGAIDVPPVPISLRKQSELTFWWVTFVSRQNIIKGESESACQYIEYMGKHVRLPGLSREPRENFERMWKFWNEFQSFLQETSEIPAMADCCCFLRDRLATPPPQL